MKKLMNVNVSRRCWSVHVAWCIDEVRGLVKLILIINKMQTMAETKSLIRTEERLTIKIGEAKNIISRSGGSNSPRDVYCALSLDQEEIYRTSTIEKSLNPFFGEEFQFEVPRKFRYLSVYVYDRDRPSKHDRVLGKVAIKREDLQAFHNKDHWFPIRPITQDSEVQGKIHLNVNFDRNNRSDEFGEKLRVQIFEACDLTMVNSTCDPFVEVCVKFTNGKQETHRTKVKKKTNCPVFDESFVFTLQKENEKNSRLASLEDVEWSELIVTMYHENSSNNTVFIGEVKLSLLGPQQRIHAATNAWYYLQPRKKRVTLKAPVSTLSSAVMDENCIGTLRMKIQYFVDHVLPSKSYSKLKELILKSANMQPVTSSAVYLLGEIIPCKADVAHCLVRILLQHNQFVAMIRSLAVWEISKVTDANTIFRGNTLVSKLMDDAMRFVGLNYLHETLRPSIERILSERKPCEIDPSRVKDKSVIHQNLYNLKIYVEDIFKAITTSALQCPSVMCQLFHDLKEIAILFFPENKEIRYSVISGFIFLRFFAPAILGPKLFGLTTEQINTQTNRTLTLISKTIQSLGNVVCAKTVSCKEEYMASMYQTFYDETHVTAVKQFLEIISASSAPVRSTSDKPVVLKEGTLIKRAQNRRRFRRKSFLQRYFKLTTESLSYSKYKGKEILYQVPLTDVLAIERVSYDSFKRNNMLQIIQPDRILYVQANNCVEEKEWMDLLTKLCLSNDKHLAQYHPAAFVKRTWLCCKSRNENSIGCAKVTKPSEGVHINNIDIDRELNRLHALTCAHMERIDNVLRACECQAAYNNDRNLLPASVIEDVQSAMVTLNSLRNVAYTVDQEQRTVLRTIARETKYGSKQAPIGDDNYLLMAGRLETATLRKAF